MDRWPHEHERATALTRRDCALTLLALGAAPLPLLAAAAGPAVCSARSGPTRAALVELYTSEGCSSCPPADAQLSRLSRPGGGSIVALSLHVPYWDAIGWKDPFAQPAFAARQRWLVAANHSQTVFTPHYFVNGREALDWRSELAPALKLTGTSAPQAQLGLRAAVPAAGALSVQADVQALPGARAVQGDWQLYVALSENGLVSAVKAGENSGVTLQHDHVVRQWLGPFAVPAAGGTVTRDIALDPRWRRDRLALTAFVQRASTGEVLQALAMPLCAAS